MRNGEWRSGRPGDAEAVDSSDDPALSAPDSVGPVMQDEFSNGPGNLVYDQHGSYRILGNTLDETTYRSAARYAMKEISEIRAAGGKRSKRRPSDARSA